MRSILFISIHAHARHGNQHKLKGIGQMTLAGFSWVAPARLMGCVRALKDVCVCVCVCSIREMDRQLLLFLV
jgi:hypothetical protein